MSLYNLKVLVVDDSEENILAITSAISDHNYSISTARSGKDALRLLLSEDFAVILLDVRMPVIDGFETAAMIREMERTADIPIIFLTAYDTNNEEIRKGYSLGGVDFIQKPFNMEILKAKVEVFADLHRKDLEIRRQSKQLSTANVKLADTNRKLMERQQELADKVIELEEANTRMTAMNDALVIAKEKGEQANKAKNLFLNNMNHEIRTPMNGMLGMIDLILQTNEVTPIQRNRLEMAKTAGISLMHVISDILDVARIESETLQLYRDDVNVRDSISTVINLLSIEAAKKKIELRQNIASAVPELIQGNDVRISQILLNLIGNAVKFTPAGSVTIHAGFSVKKNAGLLSLKISDTGIGIPVKHLEGIFDAFIQVDLSDTKIYEGAGLGLSICKKLVQLMGGNISVASEEGKGTTFTVVIPVQASKTVSDSPDSNENRKKSVGTILIAEDDPINRKVLKEMLNIYGYIVLEASNGVEAVATWKCGHPDVTLMDVQMPEMDGLEATRTIRDHEIGLGRERSVIYGLTAHVHKDDINRCLTAGMSGHIGKPIDFKLLSQTIKKHFEGDQGEKA